MKKFISTAVAVGLLCINGSADAAPKSKKKNLLAPMMTVTPSTTPGADGTTATAPAAPTDGKKKSAKSSDPLGLGASNMGKLPTLITSKTLEVESEKRIFYYRDNVVVKQGDMTLTCDELEGHYNENNQIEKMIAKRNVIVVKGDKLRATSEHGVYETTTGIITMTENPKLQQNNSLLMADVVKVFVNEDRSLAEGDVSVTIVSEKTPTPVAVAPSGTGTPPASGGAAASTVPTPLFVATPSPTPIPGVFTFGN